MWTRFPTLLWPCYGHTGISLSGDKHGQWHASHLVVITDFEL